MKNMFGHLPFKCLKENCSKLHTFNSKMKTVECRLKECYIIPNRKWPYAAGMMIHKYLYILMHRLCILQMSNSGLFFIAKLKCYLETYSAIMPTETYNGITFAIPLVVPSL